MQIQGPDSQTRLPLDTRSPAVHVRRDTGTERSVHV